MNTLPLVSREIATDGNLAIELHRKDKDYVMGICQIMIADFTEGFGDHDDQGQKLYGIRDLQIGLTYATDLLEEGYKNEPFHQYDLLKFVKWCQNKIGVV